MFDSVLGRGAQPPRVFVRGAVVSILAHVAVLGAGVYLSVRAPKVVPKLPNDVVMFTTPVVRAPPPPIAQAVLPSAPTQHPHVRRTENVVPHPDPEVPTVSRDTPDTPIGDSSASASTSTGAGSGSGAPCGDAGCTGTGTATGAPAPATTTVMNFITGMTRPTMLSGNEQLPVPREALLAKVEGKILAQCTITTAGEVTQCRLIKSLPFMDDAVLSTLQARKYTPVVYQGQPVTVKYLFTFHVVQQ